MHRTLVPKKNRHPTWPGACFPVSRIYFIERCVAETFRRPGKYRPASDFYCSPEPEEPLLGGDIAVLPGAGGMLEVLVAGIMEVLLVAGTVDAMAGVAAVMAAAGVVSGVVDEVESSCLPQALSASAADSVTAKIKGRVIFMWHLLFHGFEGNLQHLAGHDPLRAGQLITVGVENQPPVPGTGCQRIPARPDWVSPARTW